MNIVTYVPKVRGLINRLDTIEEDHLHMAMGMVGEIGEAVDLVKKSFAYGRELDRAKLLEELGDFVFYTVGLADMLGASFTDFAVEDRNSIDSAAGLATAAFAAAAAMSAATVLGGSSEMVLSSDKEAGGALKSLLGVIHAVACNHGSSLDEVLDLNIKKLSVRYPGLAFDAGRANNRDVGAEQRAMRE